MAIAGHTPAKRPWRREMEEKVWSRHGGREKSAAMWSARELAPLHLSWYKHYFFFFQFQQRIWESLTGAADGRGSHRLQKYLEVYTSQTRSQIGIGTEALLWRGKESILKYILLTFLLIFFSPRRCEYSVSDSSDECGYRNFIRCLSDSTLSGLEGTQALQDGSKARSC